ncbi:MAG TPA: glycosyltransferase family A protein, partial [bacterium]|nr:glycosyltransferase family A protein [bacterium]
GETVENCLGLTIGIPVYNEIGDLPNVLSSLLAQRIPDGIPITIIIVTNATTDGSDQYVDQWMDWMADMQRSSKASKPTEITWPPDELQNQYREQGWHERSADTTPSVKYRSYSSPNGLTIIHADTRCPGKNNALNIIRHLSPTDRIISIDGDIRLHHEAIVRLYGALSNQQTDTPFPVAAGRRIAYYDHLPFDQRITKRLLHKKNNSAMPPYIWGGLFVYDRSRIDAFPVDIMYEDLWLTEHVKRDSAERSYHKPRRAEASLAIGMQRHPHRHADRVKRFMRFMLHEKQLYTLHPEDISSDMIPVLDLPLPVYIYSLFHKDLTPDQLKEFEKLSPFDQLSEIIQNIQNIGRVRGWLLFFLRDHVRLEAWLRARHALNQQESVLRSTTFPRCRGSKLQ